MSLNLDPNDQKKLKSEIVSLVQYMKRFREEIAMIVEDGDDKSHFEGVSDQLDAIIGATEDATETILASVEKIDTDVEAIRQSIKDPDKVLQICDTINFNTVKAMEACTFQDITGQRVTKIVRSMKFVEGRVNSLADLWGRSELVQVSEKIKKENQEKNGNVEDNLRGPALPEEASISQSEIDALFD